MNIIVAGGGKIGINLIRKLGNEGHNLTLIDIKQDVIEAVVDQLDIMAIRGNCASMQLLNEIGIKNADLLIALTGEDEINLLCCMTAHSINPNLHTIARICNPDYLSQIHMMHDIFALSLSINPEKQSSVEIERILKFPGFLKRDTFAKGRVEIVELKVEGNSVLKERSLYQLNNIVKCKILVCAVLRDGEVMIPDGNFVLKDRDRIFVTAPTNELAILLNNLGVITNKVKKVIICGGGRHSFYLAQQLQKDGIFVQIIEKDHERCIELANNLPGVSIIHGDATNQNLLRSEGLEDCDAVVTLTGLDEMNMIISLYAQKAGVKKSITKVSHLENVSIQNSLSSGSVVCPTELCCSHIVRYVRAMQNKAGAALAIHTIADGLAEALEFIVDKDTVHAGIPLKNLKFKKDVLISSITHGTRIEYPTGDSCFNYGDTVIVVTKSDNVILQLDDIFEK